MASHVFTLVFAILFASHLTSRCSALRIDISSSKLTEESSKVASISCLLDSKDSDAKSVFMLVIIKNGGEPMAVLQSSGISYGDGISDPTKFQSEGLIANDADKTYLKLTISDPSDTDGGIYTCKMFYSGEAGIMKEHRASSNLTIERIDVQGIVMQLVDEVMTLKEQLGVQTAKVAELKEENLNLTRKISLVANKVAARTAFSAGIKSRKDVAPGAVIVFDKVNINEGNGYDGKTGIFTAPQDGLYAFTLSLRTYCNACVAYAHVKVNGTIVANIQVSPSQDWNQSAISCVRELTRGDEVKVEGMHRTSKLDDFSEMCQFAGYLVRPARWRSVVN